YLRGNAYLRSKVTMDRPPPTQYCALAKKKGRAKRPRVGEETPGRRATAGRRPCRIRQSRNGRRDCNRVQGKTDCRTSGPRADARPEAFIRRFAIGRGGPPGQPRESRMKAEACRPTASIARHARPFVLEASLGGTRLGFPAARQGAGAAGDSPSAH